MAAISFIPANYLNNSGKPVIENSDFEKGFNFSQNGNVFSFNGSWYCPTSHDAYTQTQFCISPQTKNCAVLVANFSFDGSYGSINGTLTLSEASTEYGNSGIASAVINSVNQVIAHGTNNTEYINAPFLLGTLNMAGF